MLPPSFLGSYNLYIITTICTLDTNNFLGNLLLIQINNGRQCIRQQIIPKVDGSSRMCNLVYYVQISIIILRLLMMILVMNLILTPLHPCHLCLHVLTVLVMSCCQTTVPTRYLQNSKKMFLLLITLSPLAAFAHMTYKEMNAQ